MNLNLNFKSEWEETMKKKNRIRRDCRICVMIKSLVLYLPEFVWASTVGPSFVEQFPMEK